MVVEREEKCDDGLESESVIFIWLKCKLDSLNLTKIHFSPLIYFCSIESSKFQIYQLKHFVQFR